MKKNLLLVFVVVMAIAFVFVWAWAKDTSQPKETGKATAIQKTEANKVTPQLIQVRPKAKMMTDLSQIATVKQDKAKTADQAGPVIARKPASYCEVQMFDASLLYRFTNRWIYNPYVPDAFATLQDPKNTFAGPCPAPQTPFYVTDVSMSFRTYGTAGNNCTAWVHGVVYDADLTDPACPVPGALLARTADVMIVNPVNYSYNYLLNQPLFDSVCLYTKYFAGYIWDSIPDLDPAAGWGPRFNSTGTTCFDYEDYGAGWYDFGAYAAAGPTAFWSSGYVKDQNTCPPDTIWFFKNAYPDAPCGVPDFEQYDHVFPNNGNAYCGPTAKADCLWWLWARGIIPRFWGGVPGDFDWSNLAMQIAALAHTDPITGTECDELQRADSILMKTIPLFVSERTVYSPDFLTLDDQLRACEDVIILLGFWYEDPVGSGNWKRFGGHFVTMTGVNTGKSMLAISDPAFDNAEMGGFGFICHLDPWPHPGIPIVHDNPANVSKDAFIVAPSTSPGGIIQLPDYWYGRETQMLKFQGQNFRTVHLPYQGPVPPTGTPVSTEIEQVIIISPADSLESATVHGSRALETENNRGGILRFAKNFGTETAPNWIDGLYYGTFILGTDSTNLNADYGDYPTIGKSFKIIDHVQVKSFDVAGSAGIYRIEELHTKFLHRFLPLEIYKYAFGIWVPIPGGTEECEQMIQDVYVIKNTGTVPLDLEKGMWLDYDVGDYANNITDFDQQHQSIWMREATPAAESIVFGMTKKPAVVNDVAITGWGLSQPRWVYDSSYVKPEILTPGTYDSLKFMMHLGWGADEPIANDKSLLIADGPETLLPGQMLISKWIKWGYHGPILPGGNDPAWRRFLYRILHQDGFYRGDVNQDGRENITDVIYKIRYLFMGGPPPIEFVDQMDVNCDDKNNVGDVIYEINYLFKNGPPPIDKNRFLRAAPNIPQDQKDLGIRRPGLFGDPNWKGLHP